MAQSETPIPTDIAQSGEQEAKERLAENYSVEGMANLVRQLHDIEPAESFVLRKDELAEIAAQRVHNE